MQRKLQLLLSLNFAKYHRHSNLQKYFFSSASVLYSTIAMNEKNVSKIYIISNE